MARGKNASHHLSQRSCITYIDYVFFNELHNGDLEKISTDDCRDTMYLKGNYGESFYYGDVYLALGQGIIGVKPGTKKPIGIRLKKYNSETYDNLCELIVRRLPKVYGLLEKKLRDANQTDSL